MAKLAHCLVKSSQVLKFSSLSLTLNIWFLIPILDITNMKLKILETFHSQLP